MRKARLGNKKTEGIFSPPFKQWMKELILV